MKIKLFYFLILLSISAEAAPPSCRDFFSNEFDGQIPQIQIRNTQDLAQALSSGMLIDPLRKDIFDFYLKIYFGNPKKSIGTSSIDDVLEALAKFPDLKKRTFREYTVERSEKTYESPGELDQTIKSLSQSAGKVRSNLLQIDANLGFWKTLLGFRDPEIKVDPTLTPAENKQRRKEVLDKNNQNFFRYLDALIKPENRQMLADSKVDYHGKILVLYKSLNYLRQWMIERKKSQNIIAGIAQAMADLVHTAGFNNPTSLQLLKSPSGMDKIQGLRQILEERDATAIELGFMNFEALQALLKVNALTGGAQSENISVRLSQLEQQVLGMSFVTETNGIVRVRPLSLLEAPFRSHLGEDCASETYFLKALDPNFQYFTMTDSNNFSSGQITIVLGTAKEPSGARRNVAFVDKIQNVSNKDLPLMLESIRRSLLEENILLAIPTEVGGENGISNIQNTRIFVKSQLLPNYQQVLSGFAPHAHSYEFENEYSRAYDGLDVKIVIGIDLNSPDRVIDIQPGNKYKQWNAPEGLSPDALVRELIRRRNSDKEEDQLVYIELSPLLTQLRRYGFDPNQYWKDMEVFFNDTQKSFKIRKQALYQLLMEKKRTDLLDKKFFSPQQYLQVAAEIKQWGRASDTRKNIFFKALHKTTWEEVKQSIHDNDIPKLKQIFDENPFLDINFNIYVGTALGEAAHLGRHDIIKYLLRIPGIDVNVKNDRDSTPLHEAKDIETIKLLLKAPGIRINPRDAAGFTPLMLAVSHRNIEIIEFFLTVPGIEINAESPFSTSPLIISVSYLPITEILLKAPGVKLNEKEFYGNTPLMRAIRDKHFDVVDLLMRTPGVDINTQSRTGETPLQLLTYAGDLARVKRLLEMPGIDVNLADDFSKTPFSIATKQGHTEILELLLKVPGIKTTNEAWSAGRHSGAAH